MWNGHFDMKYSLIPPFDMKYTSALGVVKWALLPNSSSSKLVILPTDKENTQSNRFLGPSFFGVEINLSFKDFGARNSWH